MPNTAGGKRLRTVPRVFAVCSPETYAQRVGGRLALESLEGGAGGNNSYGVLCCSGFVSIVDDVLRHAAQAAIGPSATKEGIFKIIGKVGKGEQYVMSKIGLTLFADASCNHKRTCIARDN